MSAPFGRRRKHREPRPCDPDRDVHLDGLNVLAFLATFAQSRSIMNNQVGSSIFANWALNPGLVASGDWFRLIGSGFLHFGILHLAVNMYALYILGRDTEIVMGRSRYVGIYLVSLLGGSAR